MHTLQGVPRGYLGSTLAVDTRSQRVIQSRFKQKTFFWTDSDLTANIWTDRRDGKNSYLDERGVSYPFLVKIR